MTFQLGPNTDNQLQMRVLPEKGSLRSLTAFKQVCWAAVREEGFDFFINVCL